MKKIIMKIMILLLIFSILGCLSENDGKKTEDTKNTVQTDKKIEDSGKTEVTDGNMTDREINRDEEVRKIEKEAEKVDNNLQNYKMRTVVMNKSYGREEEGTEIKYYTENGDLRKIEERVNVEIFIKDKMRKGEGVDEYYIRGGFPYFRKTTFLEIDGNNKKQISESKFYFKLENDGTVGSLFRIVSDEGTDDGEDNEMFDRGVLRDYGSVLSIIEGEAGVGD